MKRGISIATYNRGNNLGTIIESVLQTKPNNAVVSICDDGSTDNTFEVVSKDFKGRVNYYGGVNKGASANKARAMFALKDRDTACIIEDDLYPTELNWYEDYERFCLATNIHHIARVQNKEVLETDEKFSKYCKEKLGLTPIYGPAPRGDLSFFTAKLIRTIGSFSLKFKGVGYSHGSWSQRAAKAGLCGHSLLWVDVLESRDKFKQLGDTTGGRWNDDPEKTKAEIAANKLVRDSLKDAELYVPVELP